MDSANKNILEGYITRAEALEKLETKQDYIKTIVSGFNIRTKTHEYKIYYNLEDLEKALTEVDNFHKEHYNSRYVFENIVSSHIAKTLNLNPINIPKHYAHIKNSLYKNKSLKQYYKKDDIENVLKLDKFEGYLDKTETFEKLEISQDYIKNIVSGFNIQIKQDGKKLYYNLEDLENALTEVKNFHKEHYTSKYVFDNLIDKKTIKYFDLNEVTVPKHYGNIKTSTYNNKGIKTYYRKDDIENVLKKLSEFIDREETLKMLEIDSDKFVLKSFVDSFNIRTLKMGVNILYHIDDLNKAIKEITDFYLEHYSYTETAELLGVKTIDKKTTGAESIDIPKHYIGLLSKSFDTKNRFVVFKKSQIDALVNERKEQVIKQTENKKLKDEVFEARKKAREDVYSLVKNKEYITRAEALKKLSFSSTSSKTKNILQKLNEEGYLKFIEYGGKYYYDVKDIDIIIKKREEFFKEYVPVGTSSDIYFKEYDTLYRNHSKKIKQYDMPIYCKGTIELGRMHNNSGKVLKISEIKDYLEDYKSDKKVREAKYITGRNDFETFLLRLGEYPEWKNGFDKKCVYTKEKYLEYVNKSLEGKTSKKSKDTKIRQLIELGITIKEMLERHNVDEVFYISDAQINLYLNTLETHSKKYHLYRFLSLTNADFRALGMTSKLRFNFEKIKRPKLGVSAEGWENAEKDLYDFETYSQVFNYIANIDIHIPKIIEELNDTDSILHASLWLYTMLHLNNAWRNGDCDRFPELVVEDLIEEYEIDSIKWFENNRLTLSQSKAIVFRVRQWEMRMSKTQISGSFFCSDELSPAFATVVIILHLYKYQHSKVIENSDENKLIMNFDNHYNEVTASMLKNFFKPLGIKNFKFSSKKFNKSIMTYIYFLANLSGDNKALIYSAKLRSHMNLNNTSHYIDFGIDKVESLSRQLFLRGEFGYIPALLAQKVLGEGENGTFEEMTNQVMKINAVFGDIQKINTTARFLNIIASEKQNVVDMISEKSFSECQELLTNLFTCDLPSKDGSDIQCLFSKQGCQMPYKEDDFSCFDCPYHIPSIYALTRLCNNLIDNYKEYLGLPKNIKLNNFKQYLIDNPSTKSRLSIKSRMQVGLKIERRKVILREALNKYGADYIYRCLDIDRQTFIELSNLVKLDFYETYPQLL